MTRLRAWCAAHPLGMSYFCVALFFVVCMALLIAPGTCERGLP